MLLRQQILFSTASSHAKPKKNSSQIRHIKKTADLEKCISSCGLGCLALNSRLELWWLWSCVWRACLCPCTCPCRRCRRLPSWWCGALTFWKWTPICQPVSLFFASGALFFRDNTHFQFRFSATRCHLVEGWGSKIFPFPPFPFGKCH